MSSKPKRAFIIGLDALVPQLVERFIGEGRMPHIAKLVDRGSYARALPVLPTHTPVNWTTVGTGAWPGTHGITGFSMKDRTKELTNWASGADSTQVQAEFLWQMAEKVGKKSILLKWGGPTYPVVVKDGVQVDGCFCICCDHEIAGPKRFSTSDQPVSHPVEWVSADGWANVPQSSKSPVATQIELGNNEDKIVLHLLGVAADGDIDTLLICPSPDAAEPLATMNAGDYSEWLTLSLNGREGTVRFKLLEVSESSLELYSTQIMPTVGGWTHPDNVANELVTNVGPFLQRVGYNQRGEIYGAWADTATLLDEIDYQHDWFAGATKYLCENYEHELFFLHSHAPDYIQDAIMPEAEPLTAGSPEIAEEHLGYIARVYESCDRMVGRIVDEVATEDDLIMVVADHGCIGYHDVQGGPQMVKSILEANDFLVYEGDEREEHVSSKPSRGRGAIDWTRTKAIWHDTMYIYMNVKGRQPNGCIEPEDYETVRDEIIQALLDYKDPRLGRCPFKLAMRAEDAHMFGLWGDRVGDIMVCVEPGGDYGEGHGNVLPTETFGISGLQATLVMAGPGVRQGHRVRRAVWLTDVAPTVAHLMDIPASATMEGAVINEALEA
ncbi:MAG: alkaline phosphatase family protein [Planctomycetota bacterium]|jgi:predicted AlkP superfamily phosphohydrolase/phosphomutase